MFEGAYSDAVDDVSLQEEDGQVATADRDLATVERFVRPGGLLDVGCWTGSMLVAATRRGWTPEGLEPSAWACARATARGASVRQASLGEVDLEPGAYRAIVATDVIEHLIDPAGAASALAAALEPGGVVLLTVPDAGSRLARLLGRRWWSVLPMHVQYFTRRSMRMLLERAGFDVLDVRTHAKAFSVGYYADRFAAFVPVVGRLAPPAARAVRLAGRMVAPDFRDRMAVVARKGEP